MEQRNDLRLLVGRAEELGVPRIGPVLDRLAYERAAERARLRERQAVSRALEQPNRRRQRRGRGLLTDRRWLRRDPVGHAVEDRPPRPPVLQALGVDSLQPPVGRERGGDHRLLAAEKSRRLGAKGAVLERDLERRCDVVARLRLVESHHRTPRELLRVRRLEPGRLEQPAQLARCRRIVVLPQLEHAAGLRRVAQRGVGTPSKARSDPSAAAAARLASSGARYFVGSWYQR